MRLLWKLVSRLNVYILIPLGFILVFKQFVRPDGSYTRFTPRLERRRPCSCGCDAHRYRR